MFGYFLLDVFSQRLYIIAILILSCDGMQNDVYVNVQTWWDKDTANHGNGDVNAFTCPEDNLPNVPSGRVVVQVKLLGVRLRAHDPILTSWESVQKVVESDRREVLKNEGVLRKLMNRSRVHDLKYLFKAIVSSNLNVGTGLYLVHSAHMKVVPLE
jgi:hypothetical protein